MTVLLQVEKVKNCKMLSHQRFSSSFWAFQCTLCTGIHQLTPSLWREIIPAWRFTRRDPKHLRASPGLISDTLPPPPHHGSTSGRQSRLSLLHLPIRQVSWRWNDGTKQESPRYELWDQPGRAVRPRPETDESGGKSRVAFHLLHLSSSHLASLTTLLASKSPCSPLDRNHLRGLF